MVVISSALLEAGRSDRGSWSKRQLELLGVAYPPKAGWKTRILDQVISDEAAAEFVALKNQHLKPSDRRPQPPAAAKAAEPKPAQQAPTAATATLIAYTDGACRGNPGPGGWGAVILRPGAPPEELSGSATTATTNNRMEMMAAIAVLQSLPPGCQVRLHSDSQLLINTMTKGWRRRANEDLWDELDRLAAQHEVEWIWVRGHAGDLFNSRADALAVAAAKRARV